MRIPLTICGFRLQLAASVTGDQTFYSCGFRNSLILLNTYSIFCSWIPQNCSGFNIFCCGFRKNACFWSNFQQYSVVAICPWNPKQQRRFKKIFKKKQFCGFRDKSDFCLLRNPFTTHKMHSLAS